MRYCRRGSVGAHDRTGNCRSLIVVKRNDCASAIKLRQLSRAAKLEAARSTGRPPHLEARRNNMAISANGAFAGPSEAVALPEYEAALVAACRLDDEGITGGPRRALQVLEMSDDVSFGNSGLGR
jgi:hypothetical protein